MNIQNYPFGHDPISQAKEAIRKAKEAREKALNESKEKIIKDLIIDVNNKLNRLSNVMELDIKEIKHIVKKPIENDEYGFPKEDTDEYKKAIIDAVLADEKRLKEKSDIKKRFEQSARGITARTKGTPPPKTDWKKMNVDRSERYKILQSLRSNPKQEFSKEFKWNTKEFLEPFKYLESTDNYNGPFIVSILSSKKELDEFSDIEKLSEGIKKMKLGKYVVLSIYDISATVKEPRYLYMGLNYIGMEGVLEIDAVGSAEGPMSLEQKYRAEDFMKSMGIKIKS